MKAELKEGEAYVVEAAEEVRIIKVRKKPQQWQMRVEKERERVEKKRKKKIRETKALGGEKCAEKEKTQRTKADFRPNIVKERRQHAPGRAGKLDSYTMREWASVPPRFPPQ